MARRSSRPLVAAVLGCLLLLVVRLPTTGASFSSVTSNAGNSFASAATFARPLVYGGVGPVATRTSSGSMTVNYPASTAQNDLLLLVESNLANQAITTPSGWTLLTDTSSTNPQQFRFTIWWRLAPAGQTSVTLSVNTNSRGANVWVLRYNRTGGYPPTPVAATAAIATGTATPAATMAPSPNITTNQPDATVISIVTVRAGNALSLGTPQGFTAQLATTQTVVGDPVALAVADRTLVPNATTPSSPTWSQGGTAAQWAWATVAFA